VTVRLAISVEGPTEYEFCREVLRSHLAAFDVHIEPKIVVTKRNLVGPNATGGSVSIDRFRNEVRRLLPSFDYVTTLYDFYGFKGRRPGETPDALCMRMSESLENPPRLIPYQADLGPCPSREVDPPRSHLDPAYLVGEAPAGGLPRGDLRGLVAGPGG